MADGSFTSFLSASLERLREECPPAHDAVARSLAGLRVAIDVGGERVTIAADSDAVTTVPGAADGAIELGTDRTAIIALIDGTESLLDSILGDRVRLRGCPTDLVRTFDALHAYLEGAVRSPSFPALLAGFRARRSH